MKVILLVILVLSSCNSQVIKEDALKEDTFIIGRWSLVDMNGLSGYSIPEVEFAKNRVGKIITPSEEELGFTYIVSSDNKEIKFSFRDYQSYLDEKEYTYEISVVDDIDILVLTSKEGNREYTLKR